MKHPIRLTYSRSWLELANLRRHRDAVEFTARSGVEGRSCACDFRVPVRAMVDFQQDLRRINRLEVCSASLVDAGSGQEIVFESDRHGRLVIEVSFDTLQRPYRDQRSGFEADQTCVGPFLKQLNLFLEQSG